MNTRWIVKVVLFVFLLGLVACGGGGEVSFSTANIAGARLTKDEAGTQTTTTFSPDDTFYLIVDLANAPDDTRVKAAWTAVSVSGADPNTPLDDVELTGGSNTLTFNLDNNGPWPAGDYQVELFLNDESVQTLPFRVSAGLAQGDTADQTTTEATAEPTAETAVASGAIGNLEEAKSAVIQIEAEGTFVDPEVGTLYNAAGRGSGFLISRGSAFVAMSLLPARRHSHAGPTIGPTPLRAVRIMVIFGWDFGVLVAKMCRKWGVYPYFERIACRFQPVSAAIRDRTMALFPSRAQARNRRGLPRRRHGRRGRPQRSGARRRTVAPAAIPRRRAGPVQGP